jgi:molybdopterin/thiamine biosynthesis adenylyltransferase
MASRNSLRPPDRPLKPRLRDDQTVKIVGLGGVGGIVARYGAMFLATVAGGKHLRLVLIDGDQFELGNASRMLFSRQGNKAAVTRDDLLDHFADSNLTLVAIEEFVKPENLSRLFQNGDIIIASVDNHATRKLLSDFCARELHDVVLISGGNDGVGKDASGKLRHGTYGSCQVQIRRAGHDLTPSLAKYHPEIANPADRLPTNKHCTEQMVSVPQLLLTNLATASAILNALSLHLCGALHYSELGVDIADGLMRPLVTLDDLHDRS